MAPIKSGGFTPRVRQTGVSGSGKWYYDLPEVPQEFQFNGYNLFQWRQYVMRTLKGNGMKHLLKPPLNPSDSSYYQWLAEELALYSWILLSMNPAKWDDFANCGTVKDIMDAADARRHQSHTNGHMYHLFVKSITRSQGERMLLEYAMELKEVFQEIDYFRPLDPSSVGRRCILENRIFLFLKGLSPDLAYVRHQILYRDSPPSIDSLIAKLRGNLAGGMSTLLNDSSSWSHPLDINVVFELLEVMLGSSP